MSKAKRATREPVSPAYTLDDAAREMLAACASEDQPELSRLLGVSLDSDPLPGVVAEAIRFGPSLSLADVAAEMPAPFAPMSVRFVEPAASSTPARLVLDERGVELYECDWRQLAAIAKARGGVAATFADTPYSSRTHAGHDSGVDQSNSDLYKGSALKRTPTLHRNELAYSHWTPDDVREFVSVWQPLTHGWFLSLTDHVLAPAWETAMQDAGLYVFAPLACVDVGSRIRLVGDGPSNWTTWLIAGRPKTREFQRWGTLGGAYVVPEGVREQRRTGVTSVVGGKPVWLLQQLVKDYTRPGDLIADATCGAGITGVAAIAEGRRALLGDSDAAHVAIAAERLRALPANANRTGTLSLFAGVGT